VSFRFVKGLNSTNLGMTDIGPLEPGQSTTTYRLWNTSGLEFWNYQVWVQADPEGFVYEEVLTNNKANVSLVLNAKPDLTVEGINMTVSQVEITNISQGETATINIIVKNIGTKNSEATRAAIYLDDGATPVETMKIFGLAVDGYYVLQYIWDTTGATVGNHTFKVVVDTDNNNTEIFEDNNELEFDVKVLEPKGMADLIVDSISINPGSPKIGDHVEITTTVKNIGTADAVNVTLLFAYQAPGGNIEIAKEVIPLVAVGQEAIKSATWTTGILTSGNYTLNISADPLNEIRESNILNNFKTLDLNLIPTGAAAGKPDLKVQSIVMSKAKPTEDDLVKITVTIINNGDGDATQVKVIFYVDDIEEGTKTITTLAKNGATATVEFEWKAKKGMHVLKAEVYMGTSAVKDDQSSEVVTIKSLEEGASGDYMIILLVIIVIIVIAIVLMVAGGKGSKEKKGFIEEDHEDEDEEDADEEE
jgi:subtilase family serine protease